MKAQNKTTTTTTCNNAFMALKNNGTFSSSFLSFQPSGRRSNAARASSANLRDRDRRRGQTQVHGLCPTPVEPLRKIDEDSLTKVEDVSQRVQRRMVLTVILSYFLFLLFCCYN